MQALLRFATLLVRCVLAFFRSRGEQTMIELALRQQLASYAQRQPIFSPEVVAAIRTFGIDPVRTAYRGPWQNPIAER